MTEAGTCPRRNPGMRDSFWYFWIKESVSRLTSSTGISTWISRRVLLLVSVGLTCTFQTRCNRPPLFRKLDDGFGGAGCNSECKDWERAASNSGGRKAGNKRNLKN